MANLLQAFIDTVQQKFKSRPLVSPLVKPFMPPDVNLQQEYVNYSPGAGKAPLKLPYRPPTTGGRVAPPPPPPQRTAAPTGKPPVNDAFAKIATPIFEKYGIPLPVGFGQFAQEGRGAHKYGQAPYNNPFNLGAYDRNPDGAFRYPTLEKGIEAYAKLLSGKYELGHIGSGKFDTKYSPAYGKRIDPYQMMQEIARIGYASDPNYLNSVTRTPEWLYYAGQ